MIVANMTSTCIFHSCREASSSSSRPAVETAGVVFLSSDQYCNDEAAAETFPEGRPSTSSPLDSSSPSLVSPTSVVVPALLLPSASDMEESSDDRETPSKGDRKGSLTVQRITLAGELLSEKATTLHPPPSPGKRFFLPTLTDPNPDESSLHLEAVWNVSAARETSLPLTKPPPPPPPLVSALRAPSRGNGHRGPTWSCTSKRTTVGSSHALWMPATPRRVRGLWNPKCSCCFSQLHDDLLLFILSHLSMWDVCQASGVCRRWRHVTSLDQAWKTVDATDFVHHVFDHSVSHMSRAAASPPPPPPPPHTIPGTTATAAPIRTSHLLASQLRRHCGSPTSSILTIRSIEHRLDPSVFLPHCHTLLELTLTGYAALTDTHVHAMLLVPTSGGGQSNGAAGDHNKCLIPSSQQQHRRHGHNNLRKLILDDCPLLTCASIHSIARTCSQLEELSVRNNRRIRSILPLQTLWKKTTTTTTHHEEEELSSLGSTFARHDPSKLSKCRNSNVRSSVPPSLPALTGLSALFAPPPAAATAAATPATATALPSTSSSVSILRPRSTITVPTPASSGRLVRLNVSGTGISPSALVDALSICEEGSKFPPSSARLVQLQNLTCSGSGELWDLQQFQRLCHSMDVSRLQVLDLGCSNPYRGAQLLTSLDAFLGLSSSSPLSSSSLSSSPRSLMSRKRLPHLQRLTLSGHTGLSVSTLVQVCHHAPQLHMLILDGCHGLSASPVDDWRELGLALATTNSLTHLSLARCFSNSRRPLLQGSESDHVKELLHDDERRSTEAFFEAWGSATNFRILDVSGWWMLTQDDEGWLRESFPALQSLRLSK